MAARLPEQEGRAYRRFHNFDWYRTQREQWLYQCFLKKGGTPETRYPIYETLNPNGRLQDAYGPCAAWVSLKLDQTRPQDVSFPLVNSVASQVSGREKAADTLRELTGLAQCECGSLEQSIAKYFQNGHSIEAY